MEVDLRGQVALVTGGSRGIGRATALRLASSGAWVGVAALHLPAAEAVAGEIHSQGGEALAVQADVSQTEQVRQMVASVLSTFGRVDILVNNAGIFEAVAFPEMTEAQWDRMLGVHLKGTFLCSQAVIEDMLA